MTTAWLFLFVCFDYDESLSGLNQYHTRRSKIRQHLHMIRCNDDSDGGHGSDHFGKSFDVQIDPLLLSFQEEGEYCNKQQVSLSFQQELREASAHQIG